MLLRSLLARLACLSLAFAATPVQAGQVQLAWDAQVQADGTPVSNVAGYTLYYGSHSGQYQTVVPVGLTTTYTVEHVSPGQTYYFAVKAHDSTGTESAFSNEISVTLQATNALDDNPAPSVTTSPVTSSPSPSTSPTTASPSNPPTAAATVVSPTSSALTPTLTVYQNTLWELTLISTHTYANPFMDVTVTVEYTKTGSPSLYGSGFWDGDATFKLRQAFPEPGTWHYKTTATDPSDRGLHNREGDVQVLPYTGINPLYRHGFLQVSTDRRFLVHADGTPFLWMGDTLWGATVWLTEAGLHAAVADRRAKHFTVLQTNFAYADEVDTAGDTPWQGDRWNVRFMQKLDRIFTDANDQGLYLFVNGLADLAWDRGIAPYERLVEMIGARYAAHFVSFASSMADAYDPLHEQINATLRLTAPRTLLTQHPGAAPTGQSAVETAEQYYDTPWVDYVMEATGGEGDLEQACQQAIDWSLRLYNHVPPKPVVNGQAWYEGVAGGTAEMAAQLGYLSLLSGSVGYTYGTSLWQATDADLPAWTAARGATYMQYLYDFFTTLDEGRPLQPRHELIQNQATRSQERMVLGITADGLTYAAFLPMGGTITVDLSALAGTNVGVTWYNPLTGQYQDQGTTAGGAMRSLNSPFDTSPSALVLMAQ